MNLISVPPDYRLGGTAEKNGYTYVWYAKPGTLITDFNWLIIRLGNETIAGVTATIAAYANGSPNNFDTLNYTF